MAIFNSFLYVYQGNPFIGDYELTHNRKTDIGVKVTGELTRLEHQNHTDQYLYHAILVGGFNHLEKYESPWEGWHPIYEMDNNAFMFETTNQLMFFSIHHHSSP